MLSNLRDRHSAPPRDAILTLIALTGETPEHLVTLQLEDNRWQIVALHGTGIIVVKVDPGVDAHWTLEHDRRPDAASVVGHHYPLRSVESIEVRNAPIVVADEYVGPVPLLHSEVGVEVVWPGGVFLVAIREGVGERWEVGDSGNPYFTVLRGESVFRTLREVEDGQQQLEWVGLERPTSSPESIVRSTPGVPRPPRSSRLPPRPSSTATTCPAPSVCSTRSGPRLASASPPRAKAACDLAEFEERLGSRFEDWAADKELEAEEISPRDFRLDLWGIEQSCSECSHAGRLFGRVETQPQIQEKTPIDEQTPPEVFVADWTIEMFPEAFECCVCQLLLPNPSELAETDLPTGRHPVTAGELGYDFDPASYAESRDAQVPRSRRTPASTATTGLVREARHTAASAAASCTRRWFAGTSSR